MSNLTDDRMRRAKYGNWYDTNPYRALANNSVAYTEKPDLDAFSKEWRVLYKSKSGERGIINKEALNAKAMECKRDYGNEYLLNPCGEAILRDSGGLCNLTEVVVRPNDTLDNLKQKVRYATILGTLQSTLTNFRYLRKVWKNNAEEERLLGISLTGIMDHPVLSGREGATKVWGGRIWNHMGDVLKELKQVARETNEEWAEKLGINPAKQLTLIKPSGTVSLLTDTSSGIHPRQYPYYIRRVTQDNKDKLTDFMIDKGVPYVKVDGDKTIFSFYCKAPDGAITTDDISALEQLELWKIYREHWCEGNPSQTIYYTDDEYFAVADWVWKNWDSIGGLSFFPKTDHIYENAPYEEITKEQYKQATNGFDPINWDDFAEWEHEDGTTASQEMACAGGGCDI
jgi:ribonucleoside-diphosphate reductase alpha chain